MSEFSRETLLNIIETDHVQCGEASALARMALAAMDSEPDCNERKLFCSTDTARMRKVVSASDWSGTTPLYHRAAMLQAGTLTNEDTKQAWTGIPDIDNAINMLDRIDTLESCDDDRIEAVKTVLRRLAGNSPVIPDGYVMVPKEPTAQMYDAGDRQMTTKQVWDAMLAAATQLPGSEPAAVPGRWIPVSERLPEDRMSVILWDAEIGEVTSGHYSHKTQTFYHCGDAIENEITHWMPPPCAPQEVK